VGGARAHRRESPRQDPNERACKGGGSAAAACVCACVGRGARTEADDGRGAAQRAGATLVAEGAEEGARRAASGRERRRVRGAAHAHQRVSRVELGAVGAPEAQAVVLRAQRAARERGRGRVRRRDACRETLVVWGGGVRASRGGVSARVARWGALGRAPRARAARRRAPARATRTCRGASRRARRGGYAAARRCAPVRHTTAGPSKAGAPPRRAATRAATRAPPADRALVCDAPQFASGRSAADVRTSETRRTKMPFDAPGVVRSRSRASGSRPRKLRDKFGGTC
jgi:hypothetical protein